MKVVFFCNYFEDDILNTTGAEISENRENGNRATDRNQMDGPIKGRGWLKRGDQ